ncbi:iron reductase [Maritimibacter sp. 55A14]|uniref:sulfite oxidase heme-binding subunit YedZ n=1 Tax=Maritimibacter sp. 55A14 TaxID=2174844 RepID=UPI000D618C3E|nr:ferric reductase-like transmembrane domain-containing protein [Maritimibacter sp. 55A14]PWE32977.1 iron reductase [Maritimibacter sp. 55A14]
MDQVFKKFRDNIFLLWLVLAVPLLWLAYEHLFNDMRRGMIFYWTGVFAVWFLLMGLAVTPVQRLFRGRAWPRWFLKRRRYIGVAAFGYTTIHTYIWLMQEPLRGVLLSFTEPLVLFGWIGLFIFAVMAATSNDWSVRRLGPGWKTLQRWVYLAAPLTLLHWFMAEKYRAETVIIYGGLFLIIVLLRLVIRRTPARSA